MRVILLDSILNYYSDSLVIQYHGNAMSIEYNNGNEYKVFYFIVSIAFTAGLYIWLKLIRINSTLLQNR